MALYDSLASEKPAVVLDIGSRYTKFGFIGEFSPRCIIPTEIKCPRTGQMRRIFDYENDTDLYSLLVAFVHKLFFKHVLVTPKDRSVVIVESLLSPTSFRDTLAQVFFLHFEVPSLLFVPSHLVVLCSLGIRSALVVDVGFREVQVIPVFEGVPVLSAWEAQPWAAEAIERRLRSNLIESYKEIKNASGDAGKPTENIESLPDSVIEDIKVRCCFVTSHDRGLMIHDGVTPKQPPAVEYPLKGDQLIKIPGWIREASCEVLFERDNEEASLPNLIVDSILKCSIDSRKVLAENILVVGGTAMMPGFKHRLLQELKAILKSPYYENKLALTTFKIHNPPSKENYSCWLGGAIFGGTDMIAVRGLTRDNYMSLKTVPDWSNLSTNSLLISSLKLE